MVEKFETGVEKHKLKQTKSRKRFETSFVSLCACLPRSGVLPPYRLTTSQSAHAHFLIKRKQCASGASRTSLHTFHHNVALFKAGRHGNSRPQNRGELSQYRVSGVNEAGTEHFCHQGCVERAYRAHECEAQTRSIP